MAKNSFANNSDNNIKMVLMSRAMSSFLALLLILLTGCLGSPPVANDQHIIAGYTWSPSKLMTTHFNIPRDGNL